MNAIPAKCCATCNFEERGALRSPCHVCVKRDDFPFWKPKGAPDSHPMVPVTAEEEEAFSAVEKQQLRDHRAHGNWCFFGDVS